MSERLKIINPKKKFEIVGISDDTPLSAIDPIEKSGLTPESREDLVELVETPLLEACQILFDKNIKTVMSSANKRDLISKKVYIVIDFDSLSPKNQEIARSFGEPYILHGSLSKPAINLEIPINPNTTVGQIREAALEVVLKFEQQ